MAELGVSAREIATRLNVNKSSVTRWMAAGKLNRTKATPRVHRLIPIRAGQTPAEWSKAVRQAYDLDATDDQLVSLAETALTLSMDATVAAPVRLNGAGRFQAIVRQLAFGRSVDTASEAPPVVETPKAPVRVARTRSSVDPRSLLMAVK